MKVFIFAGQSNAQGYGNRIQLNPVPSWAQNAANGWTGAPTVSSDSGVQYQHPTLANFPILGNENNTGLMSGVFNAWGDYEGRSPLPPSGAVGEVASYGPELSFLRKYQDAHPTETLAYVKCVLGGSSLESDWMPADGGNPAKPMWNVLATTLAQAKARIEAVGETCTFAGFLWMQGESGASGVYYYLHPDADHDYLTKLRTFISAVRGITSPVMPVLIGRIGNQMLADGVIGTQVIVNAWGTDDPDTRRAAVNFRRQQQVLCGSDSGNCWADTDNLPVLQTGDPAYWYHFTSPGYLAMGERFYTAFAAALPPPPPPPPLQVKFNGAVKSDWVVKLNNTTIGAAGDVIAITGTP